MAVHPVLGEAIMSVLAAAAAKDRGLEIVTSDAKIHRAVATHDGDAIYNAIIRRRRIKAPPAERAVDTRLMQLVVMNHFDISCLTATDLVSMSKDRETLYDFRTAVSKVARRIPEMEDDDRREKYLRG
jgi:hypothetical protein